MFLFLTSKVIFGLDYSFNQRADEIQKDDKVDNAFSEVKL